MSETKLRITMEELAHLLYVWAVENDKDCPRSMPEARRIAARWLAAPDLLEAAKALANEATAFLSMADKSIHGQTNIGCLQRRIDEVRAAIAKVE